MSEELKKELETEEEFEEFEEETMPAEVPVETKKGFLATAKEKIHKNKMAKLVNDANIAQLTLEVAEDPDNQELKDRLKLCKKVRRNDRLKKVAIFGGVIGGTLLVATKVISGKGTSESTDDDSEVIDVPVEEVAEESDEE